MPGTPNILLLTYGGCRFDVLQDADSPVLDSFAIVLPALAPASTADTSHRALFAGTLPRISLPPAHVEGFMRRIERLASSGEACLVNGLAEHGYTTVGTGAEEPFRNLALREGFHHFRALTADADAQIDFILEAVRAREPFFGFINFRETRVTANSPHRRWRRRRRTGLESTAYALQVEAVESLDRPLGRLLSSIPAQTIVIVCADHGECFGEDGVWGHGADHPKILEVPLAVFRLDGEGA